MRHVPIVVAGIAVAGLLVGDASAAAAAATTAAGPSAAHAGKEPSVMRGSYFSHAACVAAGRQGVAQGKWSRFRCAAGLTTFWVLWTDR